MLTSCVHELVIIHANSWSLTLAFHIFFYPGHQSILRGYRPGCGYATSPNWRRHSDIFLFSLSNWHTCWFCTQTWSSVWDLTEHMATTHSQWKGYCYFYIEVHYIVSCMTLNVIASTHIVTHNVGLLYMSGIVTSVILSKKTSSQDPCATWGGKGME